MLGPVCVPLVRRRPASSRCETAEWTAPKVTVAIAITQAFAMSFRTPRTIQQAAKAPPVPARHADLVDHPVSPSLDLV
jgi:hypothetical protein